MVSLSPFYNVPLCYGPSQWTTGPKDDTTGGGRVTRVSEEEVGTGPGGVVPRGRTEGSRPSSSEFVFETGRHQGLLL